MKRKDKSNFKHSVFDIDVGAKGDNIFDIDGL